MGDARDDRLAPHVGLVTTALFMPRLLLSLPSGALDDSRLLVVTGQGLSAVAASAMVVLSVGRLNPLVLLAVTLVLGTGNAVSLPAMQALISNLVPRAVLARAVTLQAGNLARALRPSVASGLLALGKTHVAFGTNTMIFLAVIIVVLGLESTRGAKPSRDHSLMCSVAAGLRYAPITPPVRRLLVIAGEYFLTTSAVQALLPSLVSDEFGLGAAW